MALQTLTTNTAFTAIGPLTKPERWTVRDGEMTITSDTVTDLDQGLKLSAGMSIDLPAGISVNARPRDTQCLINREPGLFARVAANGNARLISPAGETLINTDVLSGNVGGWIDVSQFSAVAIQIVPTGTITTGSVIFEQSADGVNWGVIAASDTTVTNVNQITTAYALATGVVRYWLVMPTMDKLRARLSVAVTGGGSVQAFTTLRQGTVDLPVVTVQQAIGANLLVQTAPATLTPFFLNSAASTNASSVKNSAATLSTALLTNMTAAIKYVKFYNKASAPTVGTDVPIFTVPVPANGFVSLPVGPNGHRFTTGLAIAITGAQAIADATAVAAGDVQVALYYA